MFLARTKIFLHKIHSFVANQFNSAIKCLQIDGGGEYVSHRFKKTGIQGHHSFYILSLYPSAKMVLLRGNIDI